VLLPKLSFKQRYPDIRLELISESRFVDIIASDLMPGASGAGSRRRYGRGAHFTRYGDGRCRHARAFSPLRFSANAGGPGGSSLYRVPVWRRDIYAWELNQDGKKITHRPQGQWAFADSYMEAKAARLGLGLAYVPQELVADDLERGALIESCSVTASGWKALSIIPIVMCRPRCGR
jgi:DNA-binding transcriptional LysR family regulator